MSTGPSGSAPVQPWAVVRRLMQSSRPKVSTARYPGIPAVADGTGAVLTAEASAGGVDGRDRRGPVEWADRSGAAVAVGLSMTGVRAAAFSGGQDLAAMHEALFAAAGRRLAFVVNVASRAMTKQAASTQAGHDDYHAVDDTGVFQLFAHDPQAAADLTLIAHRTAELALTPGLVAQDAVLTSRLLTSVRLPETELAREYLGDPADLIDSPTPAQRLVYGDTRRRIPELFDLDYPAMLGAAQDPDSYAQGVAAQRPFYFDHLAALADRAMAEYAALTGRTYARALGYRIDDAQYVLVGQGSIVPTCEALCDWMRATYRLRVGVLNLTMFRPFPADLVSAMLCGRKAVTVLERVDQPLAIDPPLVREIRAAMSKAVENGRATGAMPHPGIAPCRPQQVPEFYSGCYGLGGRDVQASDLVAVVENMRADRDRRRLFYLGVDFVRPGTRLPKLQVWQEQLVDHYPHLGALTLRSGEPVSLLPPDALSLRIHARSAGDAAALGRRVAVVAADVFGLQVRAHLAAGGRPAGQPAPFDVTMSREPLRAADALGQVQAVLVADPLAFAAGRSVDALEHGGALVLDHSGAPDQAWAALPGAVRRTLAERRARLFVIDTSRLLEQAAPDARDRGREAALVGAFLKASDLAALGKLRDDALFARIGERLHAREELSGPAVADYVGFVRRGFSEAAALDPAGLAGAGDESMGRLPAMPAVLGATNVRPGIAHGGRFWEQVGVLRELGQDGLADPFAAFGAMPAATSAIRDMTTVRLEVPEFLPDRCTGCGECWVQCPDAAIPGVVSDVGEVLAAAVDAVEKERPCDRLRQVLKPLAGETRRQLKVGPAAAFASVLAASYATVADKLGLDPERRGALDDEFAALHAALGAFPLARTETYFDGHEKREKGTGGLLSVTVDPAACKGCGVCVTACPEDALRMVRQTDGIVEVLRRNWSVWQHLPETHDRYAAGLEGAAQPSLLPALLLRQRVYRSMIGGDSAEPGSTEKTALHLVLSAVHAFVLPRVRRHVDRLTELIDALDARARELLASDAPVDSVATLTDRGTVALPLEKSKHRHVEWLATLLRELKDLRWRYTEGPGGKGRAACGIAGATDGSTAWAAVYPYNPYPVPWASHLLRDAPSVALGLFDGQMRKMARGFAWVRRAELELADAYAPEEHEAFFERFDWRQFSDEEFALCPPLLVVGSDTAIDAGFQHLSQLLESGRPVRVVVLDAEGAAGPAGARANRRNLALLAIAHRQAFVLQSSPAVPSHLLAGVLRGLASRHPAVFAVHCPHPPVGSDSGATARAARLALESRAFPALVYDPAAGASLVERLDLDGNPSPDDAWPWYELTHVDGAGANQALKLPVTIADWAASEAGYRACFTQPTDRMSAEDLVRFDEYLAMAPEERDGKVPFIFVLDAGRRLGRLLVADEVVALGLDRLQCWSQLRQMAGLEIPGAVRDRVAKALEADFERRTRELESRHRATLADMEVRYPTLIARRLVEGLIRAAGDGTETIGDLLRRAAVAPGVTPLGVAGDGDGGATEVAMPAMPVAAPAASAPDAVSAPPAESVPPDAPVADAPEASDEPLTMDPYIQSALCTSCDECININKRMFAYNKQKQAFIKDPRAGTFRELVMAAEKCPVGIIHPGTPVNPDEKDLARWVQAAARFM